jgi:2-phospho-L-lactate guanylyltransferase
MNLWAILPVKSLAETKSRLSGVLSPNERAELTITLLSRTLGLLQMVTAVRKTIVVSRDPVIAEMAAAAHCQTVAEPMGSGLNGAVTLGATAAADNGATHLLVLPSDLPFLRQDELELVLGTAVSPHTLLICSDQKRQGTNALVLPAGSGFRFAYGRYSYQRHQAEAARLGWACQTRHLPSIAFDLDSEADYNRYTNEIMIQGQPHEM